MAPRTFYSAEHEEILKVLLANDPGDFIIDILVLISNKIGRRYFTSFDLLVVNLPTYIIVIEQLNVTHDTILPICI